MRAALINFLHVPEAARAIDDLSQQGSRNAIQHDLPERMDHHWRSERVGEHASLQASHMILQAQLILMHEEPGFFWMTLLSLVGGEVLVLRYHDVRRCWEIRQLGTHVGPIRVQVEPIIEALRTKVCDGMQNFPVIARGITVGIVRHLQRTRGPLNDERIGLYLRIAGCDHNQLTTTAIMYLDNGPRYSPGSCPRQHHPKRCCAV